jgi:hypothetical protein
MKAIDGGIDPDVKPSGTGCVECLASCDWWLHLRRCAKCGHIGCCDTSPNQHATAHFRKTGHRDYETGDYLSGPELAPPRSHPDDQPVPGPQGCVPRDWQTKLHAS